MYGYTAVPNIPSKETKTKGKSKKKGDQGGAAGPARRRSKKTGRHTAADSPAAAHARQVSLRAMSIALRTR